MNCTHVQWRVYHDEAHSVLSLGHGLVNFMWIGCTHGWLKIYFLFLFTCTSLEVYMYMTQGRNYWKSYGGKEFSYYWYWYTHSSGKPLLGMYYHIENILLAVYLAFVSLIMVVFCVSVRTCCFSGGITRWASGGKEKKHSSY